MDTTSTQSYVISSKNENGFSQFPLPEGRGILNIKILSMTEDSFRDLLSELGDEYVGGGVFRTHMKPFWETGKLLKKLSQQLGLVLQPTEFGSETPAAKVIRRFALGDTIKLVFSQTATGRDMLSINPWLRGTFSFVGDFFVKSIFLEMMKEQSLSRYTTDERTFTIMIVDADEIDGLIEALERLEKQQKLRVTKK